MTNPNKSICHQYNLRSKVPSVNEESSQKKDGIELKKRKSQEKPPIVAHKRKTDKEVVPLNQQKKTDDRFSNVTSVHDNFHWLASIG